MDSSTNASSALDTIDTVAFKVGVRGYNIDEVDEFLERLSVETRQLKDQLTQMRQQLRLGAERINQLEGGRPAPSTGPTPVTAAPAPAPAVRTVVSGSGAEQVTALIVMAQQFIEQAQSDAETKARELTTAAQERAREIINEARSRAEDEVNRLNGLKQRLSEDVDTLTRQLDTERTRLSAALAEFSRWVESSLQVGGAPRQARSAPTMSSRPTAPVPSQTPPPAPPRGAPAPATASSQPQTIGQVLNFEQPSGEDRS
ncbi:MAG: DivIVA domain-containing protein [Acidimicrobiales bacterium]|jgi:cell division initiation protein